MSLLRCQRNLQQKRIKKVQTKKQINFFLKNASMQKVLCKNCKKNIRKMKSRENCFYYWPGKCGTSERVGTGSRVL